MGDAGGVRRHVASNPEGLENVFLNIVAIFAVFVVRKTLDKGYILLSTHEGGC